MNSQGDPDKIIARLSALFAIKLYASADLTVITASFQEAMPSKTGKKLLRFAVKSPERGRKWPDNKSSMHP